MKIATYNVNGIRAAAGAAALARGAAPDTLRALHPDARIYTFWKYLRNAYARDAGLRIDHILLSPAAARRLQSAGLDREVRGWEHSSDLDRPCRETANR